MKKRGKKGAIAIHLTFTQLINLILFISVFVVCGLKIQDIRNDTSFEKTHLSTDLGILTDAVYASPEKLAYTYTDNAMEFSVKIDKGLVAVTSSEREAKATLFPYLEDLSVVQASKTDTVTGHFVKQPINFLKTKNSLTLSTEKEIEEIRLECEDALAYNIKLNEYIEDITLDPSYHGAWPGLTGKTKNEAEITHLIANAVLFRYPVEKVKFTRAGPLAYIEKTRIENTKDSFATISILTGNTNQANIYVLKQDLRTKKLACSMLEKLSEVEGISKGSIRTSTDLILRESQSNITIIIEVGDIENYDYSQQQMSAIAGKITEGIQFYNE